jgi:hypothetical protein
MVEEQGYDPPLAYLNLLLEEVGEDVCRRLYSG